MARPPWDAGEPPSQLTELIEQEKLNPCRVLDIGCGTGTSVIYLATKGFDAFGLDISRIAIRKAKSKAARHDVKCRFYRLDFTDPRELVSADLPAFDLVVDNGCFHSLSPTDRSRYSDSLLHVSHVGTSYLLWCFLRASGPSFGPPGVDHGEVEDRFTNNFRILEQRELETPFRKLLFFQMERSS
jgi:cyclopropane fatty-acyl-phospholipid synthase-like methyltransferase